MTDERFLERLRNSMKRHKRILDRLEESEYEDDLAYGGSSVNQMDLDTYLYGRKSGWW